MGKVAGADAIRIRGARHNNLKGFDVDVPVRSLVVVTGLSGSGKSSLAFDTLYAEGQRRYIETFSPYARQFFDRMDKPRVDAIEGIPPAIALEQRNSVRTTRSTVGTMTEICDHLKVLWPHVARLHCRTCGQPVTKDAPLDIWKAVREAGAAPAEVLVTFQVPLSEKLSLAEQLALIGKQGFQRVLLDGAVRRLDEAEAPLGASGATRVTVVQDRVRVVPANRARFVEACEQAYHFGHGKLTVWPGGPSDASVAALGTAGRPFTRHLHCARCDIEYREPMPALFSFNHPVGACPGCKGFGRIIAIDYDLAIPDRSKTLAQGAVRPWQTGTSAECQADLARAARREGVPLDVPFRELPPYQQRWVIEGDPDYGEDNQWPKAWYGVKGYFRWLESKAYKMHVRVLLSRYRAYTTCPACEGRRLQPDALLWRLPVPGASLPAPTGVSATDPTAPAPGDRAEANPGAPTPPPPALTLADFYALPIERARQLIDAVAAQRPAAGRDPLSVALSEVRSRLAFLEETGVGYLTLDRPTRTLSGGETQRVNLTTCLGTRLVNTLFVLDEPSVGLHPRDTDRLVRILARLRDLGNTVVVVEHEPAVMRAADRILDLGPGHGEAGGHLVCQGNLGQVLEHPTSLTGAYLSGRRRIDLPPRRAVRLVAVEPGNAGIGSPENPPPPRSSGTFAREAPAAGESPGRTSTRGAQGARGARARRPLPGSEAPPGSTVDTLALADQVAPYRAPGPTPHLHLRGITRHNLRDLEVRLPLGRLVCLAGVSGSGKTTLAGELLRLLRLRLGETGAGGALEVREAEREPGAAGQGGKDEAAETGTAEAEVDAGTAGDAAAGLGATLDGAEQLGAVLLVDQSPIGRTPRSNPAVYSGAFDHIRELFARTDAARAQAMGASAFSFNSRAGQCETCRGAGFEKIEMQFLSDVFIRCPACEGRRYRPHILEIKLAPPGPGPHPAGTGAPTPPGATRGLSIADVLDLTVDDAVAFLAGFAEPAAARAVSSLRVVQDVGLGYLRLGQPINTLSGGESQRLKLAGHLAEFTAANPGELTRPPPPVPGAPATASAPKPSLFVFDEPTTGLHFDDVRVLLEAFQRLVAAGHSVLIIEHNLEVLKCADWLIDLGPDGGEAGGRVVVAGTPESVAACEASHTGSALRGVLPGA